MTGVVRCRFRLPPTPTTPFLFLAIIAPVIQRSQPNCDYSSLFAGRCCPRAGCFGSQRSSDHDAVLDRVLSPSPVLKALAPPPGTSYLGTPRLLGLGRVYSSVSFEISLSSYGCGSLRSWASAVVVSSRSNGTWEGRSIGHRLESFPDVTLGQLPFPVLLVISKIRIITFSCIVVVS